MVQISTSKGLNLPFKEKTDQSKIRECASKTVAIDLSRFTAKHLKCMKNEGEDVKKGEIIAKELHLPIRVFISTFSGKITEIIRGERRRITAIVIETTEDETIPFEPVEDNLSKEHLMDIIFKRGLSFFIHMRPFARLITPEDFPRSIFINTVVSAPLTPSFKHILKTNESFFEYGLKILSAFAPIHLVSNEEEFREFKHCSHHKAIGPHPIQSPSLHILAIDPIKSVNDVVWTLDVYDVLQIGFCFKSGNLFSETIVGLAGNGFEESERHLLKTQKGACIHDLCQSKETLISGNPLTGKRECEYLGEKDWVICAFKENKEYEILPFAKLGSDTPTMTRTYLGGFRRKKNIGSGQFCLGGETRPFVLKDIYQKHFPFNIYIEPLIKALLAEDYDLALSLGFLDIDTDDLALAEYICPSKISLMSLFEKAKKEYLELVEK